MQVSQQPRDIKLEEPRDLAARLKASADAEVLKAMAVGKSFLEKFLNEVGVETDRVEAIAQGILKRAVREDLDTLVATLRAIINNCWKDPEDFRKELLLASIVREIADAADEYARTLADPRKETSHAAQKAQFEKDISTNRLPWVRKLLEQMTLDDSTDAIDRLELRSVHFKKQ